MPERPRCRGAGSPAGPPEPEAALESALRYLGTRPRTRREIDLRLRRAGASDAVIEATLERLTSLGYVDDAEFARWWADQRDRHAPRGRRMLEAELRQHGVSREAIEIQRAEAALLAERPGDDEEALPATERQRAEAALARHLRGRPLPSDPRAVQRVGMYLVRRGFDPETIRSVLRSAGEEAPQEHGDDAGP